MDTILPLFQENSYFPQLVTMPTFVEIYPSPNGIWLPEIFTNMVAGLIPDMANVKRLGLAADPGNKIPPPSLFQHTLYCSHSFFPFYYLHSSHVTFNLSFSVSLINIYVCLSIYQSICRSIDLYEGVQGGSETRSNEEDDENQSKY